MAKNVKMTRNGNVVLPMAVAAGTVAGEVLFVGSSNLRGYTLTPRTAAIDVNSDEAYVHGLAVGEASVELLGINLVVQLTVGGAAVAVGDPVYLVAGTPNTYTQVVTGNTLIGYALTATSAAGQAANVGLLPTVS